MDDSNLPEDFETKFPELKRDARTGKYRAYGLGVCHVLGNSPQYLDALKNADSIAGIVVFLEYLQEHDEIESISEMGC